MICVSATALVLALTTAPVDGIYIRETRFVPAMSIAKVKSLLGVEDYRTPNAGGLVFGWNLKEGAYLSVRVDRGGSIQSATVSIDIGDKAPQKDIYVVHTYTGKTRKVYLGKTRMKSVREWFGYGYKGVKSDKPVARPPDVLEYMPDDRELYGWTYEFGDKGECVMDFLSIFWEKELAKPPSWRDGLPVRMLIVKASE